MPMVIASRAFSAASLASILHGWSPRLASSAARALLMADFSAASGLGMILVFLLIEPKASNANEF